jgi:uncharacterized ferredoxin-like protein
VHFVKNQLLCYLRYFDISGIAISHVAATKQPFSIANRFGYSVTVLSVPINHEQ